MNFSKLNEGDYIKYIGDSFAYGGSYKLIQAESTYTNPDNCPEHQKGKLMIIEFMNNGTPMFFTLDMLDRDEWEKVPKNN